MKIAFVGQPEYFRFCYENDLSSDHTVEDFEFRFGSPYPYLAPLLNFDPDITFFFRGEYIERDLLDKLGGIKISISSEPFPRYIRNRIEFTTDSLKRYLNFRSSIRSLPFDYVFHYDESSIDFMAKDGLLISGAFPFPVATEAYVPPSDKNPSRDIFFIGRSTAYREKFLGPLKHSFDFLHICHGIYGLDLVNYIHSAKINLNVHAENEISWEPRMQMLLAAGAFVISEPLTPNHFLRPGVDYIEAKSPAEMYQLTKYYLSQEEERLAIAQSGRQRVKDILCARTNFSNLILNIQNGTFPRYTTRSSRAVIDLVDFFFKTFSTIKQKFFKLI